MKGTSKHSYRSSYSNNDDFRDLSLQLLVKNKEDNAANFSALLTAIKAAGVMSQHLSFSITIDYFEKIIHIVYCLFFFGSVFNYCYDC